MCCFNHFNCSFNSKNKCNNLSYPQDLNLEEVQCPAVSIIGPTGATGPIGPTGPTGATGATGPAGESGIMSTVFLTAPSVTDTQPVLVQENSYPTDQSDITLAGENGVNLAAGTYLMRFGATVTSTNGIPPTISLTVNGLVESGTLRTGVAFGSASLTGDALITIPNPATLAYNVTASSDLTYDEIFLIISKLG